MGMPPSDSPVIGFAFTPMDRDAAFRSAKPCASRYVNKADPKVWAAFGEHVPACNADSSRRKYDKPWKEKLSSQGQQG